MQPLSPDDAVVRKLRVETHRVATLVAVTLDSLATDSRATVGWFCVALMFSERATWLNGRDHAS